MKALLDKHLPEFSWAKAKAHHYQDERWVGTPKDPKAWPEGTMAEASRKERRWADCGCFYQLIVLTNVDLVSASDIQDKVSDLPPVLRTFKYRHDEVVWHRDRLTKQPPPPQTARIFHKSEVKPGDTLLPMPGKELLIWDRNLGIRGRSPERVIASYRHGQSGGYDPYNLPGSPAGQHEVTVDRVNTRGIFVRVAGESKPRKITSLGHHGTSITDGWLLAKAQGA